MLALLRGDGAFECTCAEEDYTILCREAAGYLDIPQHTVGLEVPTYSSGPSNPVSCLQQCLRYATLFILFPLFRFLNHWNFYRVKMKTAVASLPHKLL